MIKSFFDEQQIYYKQDASLKKYNTYRLNTICSYLVFPKTKEELIKVLKKLQKENIKYYLLGNGSNVIFKDDYYNGVVIRLDYLNNVTYNDNLVTVGAGYSLIKIAIETVNKGLSGLEFAAGIPGFVGASTAMNAGAYNSDMSHVVKKVHVLNNKFEEITLNNADLAYEYRDSFLKKHPEYIVLETTFELTDGNTDEMKEQITERRNKRMASQPLNMPSAGSVFRNPENMHAGALIEQAGLKGYSIGGAMVSKKHANFIVNTGNATGEDIVNLIDKVQKEVKEKFNVELKLEQIIVE